MSIGLGKSKRLTGLRSVDSIPSLKFFGDDEAYTYSRLDWCNAVGANIVCEQDRTSGALCIIRSYDTLFAHPADGFDTAPNYVGSSSRRARTR